MSNKALSVDLALLKAKTLAKKGAPDQAMQLYRAVLKKFPGNKRAIEGLKSLTRPKPNQGQIALNTGPTQEQINGLIALYQRGRLQDALEQGAALAERHPNVPLILNILGAANAGLGRLDQAVARYTKALQIKPDFAEAHNNLGNALKALGKHEEAIASYTKCLQIKPDFAEAHNNLGIALSELGMHEEAIASHTKALQIKPDYADAQRTLGVIKNYKIGDPQVAQMLELIANPSISENNKKHLSFALGKAYDDIGDAESCFQHLLEGNRLRKKELGYDINSDKRLFSRIKSIFAADELPTIEETQSVTERKKQPIFIVGMPRSGTTLVEQVLASHSQVYGADELEILDRIVRQILGNIHKVHFDKLTMDIVRDVRNVYLAKLDILGDDEPRITDKMPLNFMWTGFILTAMPEAKVINLQRDPVATCWSIFKHYFSSKGGGFAYDLVDIAEFYKLYIDLMDFWQGRFPNQIYDLNYEALTENQEKETRKLLNYCGLGWEDQCLAFHKTKRAVKTASSVQVRQEMYKGSSETWRKYETLIQPMIQALKG